MLLQSHEKFIAPLACIPDDWEGFNVTRRFRGTEYTIHISRTGERTMTVDGERINSNVIPLSGKQRAAVEVTL